MRAIYSLLLPPRENKKKSFKETLTVTAMAAARLSIDLDYEQARLLGGAQSAFALGPVCFSNF